MACQFFEFIVACFRRCKFHHFNFIELVLPYKPLDVFSVTSRLLPEAGGGRGIRNGERIFIQYLVTVDVCNRDLRGWDKVVVPPLNLKKVFLKLGQLPRADKTIAFYHKRRQYLQIAVFFCVKVKHEIDKRPLKERANAFHKGKPRARKFPRPLKINNAEGLPYFHMFLRGEGKRRLFAGNPYYLIAVFIMPNRGRRMGEIGYGKEEVF